MAINITNTIGGEQFNFLANQSSILRSTDTNKITINGVNVIVNKPKKGDIICVKGGKVIWIDGLSINPKQLSQDIEPVGICVSITGNKAMVKYRKETSEIWAKAERNELAYSTIMNDNVQHTLTINLNNQIYSNKFSYKVSSREKFVIALNDWFRVNNPNYSAELVDPDTDLPSNDRSDNTDNKGNYLNRIIVNIKLTSNAWNAFSITEDSSGIKLNSKRVMCKHIKAISNYYKNNGFSTPLYGGCCYAKYYDYYSINGAIPTSTMTSLNYNLPVKLEYFSTGTKCQILRDNFTNYNKYLESMLVKYPCGTGGIITEFPSGKENTYKLADCTFLDNVYSTNKTLYEAAHYAASINVDAPGLEEGNWWLPSAAEMVQMMRDITYGTNSWDSENIDNNTDIVNRVLFKLNSSDSTNWSMLSASIYRCTSSLRSKTSTQTYDGLSGALNHKPLYEIIMVAPITIYEF